MINKLLLKKLKELYIYMKKQVLLKIEFLLKLQVHGKEYKQQKH